MAVVLAPLPPGLVAATGCLAGAAFASMGVAGGATVAAVAIACSVAGVAVPAVRTAGLALLLGLVSAARAPPGATPSDVSLPLEGVRVLAEGTVRETEPASPAGLRFVLDVRRLVHRGEHDGRVLVEPAGVRVRALVPPESVSPPPLFPGDRVEVVGTLSALRAPTNPGTYDARAAWSRRGVEGRLVVSAAEGVRVLRRPGGLLAAIASARDASAASFTATLAPDDAGLARSLVLGDRGALHDADRRRFERAGAAHVLAISGAHVAILLGLLLGALRRLGFPTRAAAAIALPLVLLYVPYCGGAPPVVRAAAGATLFLAGRIAGREPSSGTLLASVAAGFLVVDPGVWHDAGFRLSFAAAGGLVLLLGPTRRLLVPSRLAIPGVVPVGRAPLRTALAAGLAAWLGSLPVALAELGQLSWIAVPVGLVAVPVSTLVVLLGAVHLATAQTPGLGEAVSASLAATSDALRVFLDAAPALGLETVRPEVPAWPWFAAYGVALLVAGRAGGRAALAGAAVLAVLLGTLREGDGAAPDDVRLLFLDVGHGQACLLETPDGSRALLDAGSLDRPGVGRRFVLPALREAGVARLDLATASHADADHVNALADVLAEVPADVLAVAPGSPDDLVATLGRAAETTLEAGAGDVLLHGAWGRLVVLSPPRDPAAAPVTNDGCLVLSLETPHGRVLLPADREEAGVDALLAEHPRLAFDALCLPHHGHAGRGLDRLLGVSPGALRLASAPPSMDGRLPPGTWSTGASGALLVTLGEGGLRVEAPWPPRRPEAPGYDPAAARRDSMQDPYAIAVAAALLAAIAWASVHLSWLTLAGAAGAAVLGFVATLAYGFAGLAALFAPFVVATLLGKAPGGCDAPETAVPRTFRQVAANGVPALVAAVASATALADARAAFLGALAALGADTVATEVGTRLGGTPRSAVTFRPLPRGASGGVSAAGLVASVPASFLAPGAFALLSPLPAVEVLVVAAAGFVGGLADSVLGAALQRAGRCEGCGERVETAAHCGRPVPTAPGRLRLLDNDAVNLVNGAVAAVLAAVAVRAFGGSA
jgi:competence protein ComEC